MRSKDAEIIQQKRKKQKENLEEYHHPKEKIDQLNRIFSNKTFDPNYKILELFCGKGNLTREYLKYGMVESYDRILGDGDSYKLFHKIIYDNIGSFHNKNTNLYNLIDLDPYGYPVRFFPDIFHLIDNGILIVTSSIPGKTKANAWTQKLVESYFGVKTPSKDLMIDTICNEAMKHWRLAIPLEDINLGNNYRFVFSVKRVHAAKYLGTTNLGNRGS